MPRDRDSVVAHHGFEDILVHAERRREHARPDVRDVRQLEHALDGPVLAEGPVEDRHRHVDGPEGLHRPRLGRHGQRLRSAARS